ncbi:hypothetical protein OsJ_04730 [Oryza sativa Japonica Group]|uniref:Uncharacterized protein n=1 Tax=Oryza sativa subsp. japonica TaxID=39947 RepID=A3A1F6_ORYSJ|nr:hypothetical protein OsJ_04730 [Oryza sativa Japonica Group]
MARRQGVASMLTIALIIGAFASAPTTVQSIGVCYGVLGNNLPSRSEVVQLYKSKASTACASTTPTRRRSTPCATPASPSSSTSATSCPTSPPAPPTRPRGSATTSGPTTRPSTSSTSPSATRWKAAPRVASSRAIRNVNSALASSGLGAIKASTAVKFDVISNSYPPSAGVFRDAYMKDIARYLASTGAPLLANVYPYFAYRGNPRDISLNYATFRPGTTVRDPNNGLTYTNLFDAMMDAVYAALEKAGAGNVRVVVSESGWPSAGGFGASVDNARAYNQGLIDHVGRGTPKRPGALEAYIFAMFNENQKNGDPTERNFGLFYPNKSPVYPIRF